jgi:hypothetical protein
MEITLREAKDGTLSLDPDKMPSPDDLRRAAASARATLATETARLLAAQATCQDAQDKIGNLSRFVEIFEAPLASQPSH